MIKYSEGDATRNGLLLAGWPGPIGLSAIRGNGTNADAIKADFDRPFDNMPAEAFLPDEAYRDYTLHIPTGAGGTDVAAANRTELSVLEQRRRWASRGDGLSDLATTDAECPLPDGPWTNVVLRWPEVLAACVARMDSIRAKMGV